jgi:hypothetical protein
MITWKEWLAARESSPFTRTRRMADLGLGPDIPDASRHSHSTYVGVGKFNDKAKSDEDRIIATPHKKKKNKKHNKKKTHPKMGKKNLNGY